MTQSARVPTIISTISIMIITISIIIVIVIATIIILMPTIMIAVPMIVIVVTTVSIVIVMMVVADIIVIVMVPFCSVKIITTTTIMIVMIVVVIATTLASVPTIPSLVFVAVVIISVVMIIAVVMVIVMVSIVDWVASATATTTCAHGGGVQLGKVGVGVSAHCQTIEALHVKRLARVVADLAHLIKVVQVMLIVHLIMVIVAVTVMTASSVIVLLRDVVGRSILLLVILTLLMSIASIVAELGIVIAAPSLVMAWCIRGYRRVRLITAKEAHVVNNSVPSVLLAQQRQEFKHQLIVGHMALSEHTLDLLEVPLGQAQRFYILRWPPHMPILAVWPINAEPTSVIVAFPANSATRVVALCGNVTFTGHVVSALRGWG